MSQPTVTYICAQTGKQEESTTGLPEGWVVSTSDLAEDKDKPVPEHFTVIAFSSKEACNDYRSALLKTKMMS